MSTGKTGKQTARQVVSKLIVLTGIAMLLSSPGAGSNEVNIPELKNADFSAGPIPGGKLSQQISLPIGRYELTAEFKADNEQAAENISLSPPTSNPLYQAAIVNNAKSPDGWVTRTVRFSATQANQSIHVGLSTDQGAVLVKRFSLRALPPAPLPVDGIWYWDGSLIPYTNYPAKASDTMKGGWPSRITRERFNTLFTNNAPVIGYAKRFNALMIRAALLRDDIKTYQRILAYQGKGPDTDLASKQDRIFALLDDCNRSFGQIYQEKISNDSRDAAKAEVELGNKLQDKLTPVFDLIQKQIETCEAAVQSKTKEYARPKSEPASFRSFLRGLLTGRKPESTPKTTLNAEYKFSADGTPSRMFFVAWTDKLQFREMMPDLGIWRAATGGKSGKDTGTDSFDWAPAIENQRELEAKHFACAGFCPYICVSDDFGPLPKSFKDKHLQDPDIWRGQTGQAYNMYNPKFREAAQQMASDMGSQLKGTKWLFYVYLWEHNGPQTVDLPDNEPDHPSALKSFHKFLEQTYGSMEKLNKEWRAAYTNISDIKFPKHAEISGSKAAIGNPIIHDIELWRQQEYASFAKGMYQAWKKADPEKPILAAHNSLFRNIDPTYVFAYCDMLDSHQGYPRDFMAYRFCTSNARIKGKHMARWENGWNVQEESQRWGDERAQYAELTKYMYRMALQDEDYQNWCFPYTGQSWTWMQAGWMQSATDYMTMRYAATGIPVGIRRLQRMEKALLDTTLAPSDTLLIYPRTSWLSMGFGPVRDVLIAVVLNLYQHGRAFEFRSEADIASGAEKLDAYKTIILPVGAFLDDGVDEKLLAWANQGGLLVLLGPAGVYNKHGFVSGRLTRELVKDLPEVVATPEREEWTWKWAAEAENKVIIRKKIGTGEILMTTMPFNKLLLAKDKPFEEILQAMEQAAPAFSRCNNNNFGLWDLSDKQGGRYLGIINHNAYRDLESEIVIRGQFKQVIDLDIPGEFSVPVKQKDNQTCFAVTLQPGGLTVLRLEK